MPRACVIVLDAVGAGELPDADQYGDEGSNTLGNVASAVGGLDLPNLEALGLGNVEPLEGCPPQPGAPAVAGRLFERSKGKDTTTGHWSRWASSQRRRSRRTAGSPHDVIDFFAPHRPRRDREQARVGHGVIQSSARSISAPASGSSTRPPTRLPDRRTRRPCHSTSLRSVQIARGADGQARRRS